MLSDSDPGDVESSSPQKGLKTCALCNVKGDGRKGEGRLVGPFTVDGKKYYVHRFCLIFSPQVSVFEENREKFSNAGKEIKRGRNIRCVHCKRGGATIGCTVTECPKSFHLQCAIDANCTYNIDLMYDKEGGLFCSDHNSESAVSASSIRDWRALLKPTEFDKEVDSDAEVVEVIIENKDIVSSSVCSVCSKPEVMEISNDKDNKNIITLKEKMVECSSCGVHVHGSCYGIIRKFSKWYCDLCVVKRKDNCECVICEVDFGYKLAFKPMKDSSKFCHLVCALWDKKAVIENIRNMSQIYLKNDDEEVDEGMEILNCKFCNQNKGSIIKCPGSEGSTCSFAAHPSCALINKLFFHLGSPNTNVKSEIFCSEHTPIALFCVCNLPYVDDGRNMIGCENCDNWYHSNCVNINPLKNEAYQCDACKNGIENVVKENKEYVTEIFTEEVLLYNAGGWIERLSIWESNCQFILDKNQKQNITEEKLSSCFDMYNDIMSVNPFQAYRFNPVLYNQLKNINERFSSWRGKYIDNLNLASNSIPTDVEAALTIYTAAYNEIYDLPINNLEKIKVCHRYASLKWINKTNQVFTNKLSLKILEELVKEGQKVKNSILPHAFNIENLYEPLRLFNDNIQYWFKEEDNLINRYGSFAKKDVQPWREYVMTFYSNVFDSNSIHPSSLTKEKIKTLSGGLNEALWKREIVIIFKILEIGEENNNNVLSPSHLEYLYEEAISQLHLPSNDEDVMKLKNLKEKAHALEQKCNLAVAGKLPTTVSSLISIRYSIESMRLSCPASVKIMHIIHALEWGEKAREVLSSISPYEIYDELHEKLVKIKISSEELSLWKEEDGNGEAAKGEEIHIGLLFGIHENFVRSFTSACLWNARSKNAITAAQKGSTNEGADFDLVKEMLDDKILKVVKFDSEVLKSLKDIFKCGNEWYYVTQTHVSTAFSANTAAERNEIISLLTQQIKKLESLPYKFSPSMTKNANNAIDTVNWALEVRLLLDKMSLPSSDPPPTLAFLEELANTALYVFKYSEIKELKAKIEMCNQWIKKGHQLLQSDSNSFSLKQHIGNHEDMRVYIPLIELLQSQITFISSGGLEGTSLLTNLSAQSIPASVSRQKTIMKNQYQVINAVSALIPEGEIAWGKFAGYPFWPCILTKTKDFGQREIKLLGMDKVVECTVTRLRPWSGGNPQKEPLLFPELLNAIELGEKAFRERKKNLAKEARSSNFLYFGALNEPANKKIKREDGQPVVAKKLSDPNDNSRRRQFLSKLIEKLNTYGSTYSNADDCKRLGELIEEELYKLFPFIWPVNEISRENYTNKAKLILAQFKDSKNQLLRKLISGQVDIKNFVSMDEKAMASYAEKSEAERGPFTDFKFSKSINVPLLLLSTSLPGCSTSTFDTFSVNVYLKYKKEIIEESERIKIDEDNNFNEEKNKFSSYDESEKDTDGLLSLPSLSYDTMEIEEREEDVQEEVEEEEEEERMENEYNIDIDYGEEEEEEEEADDGKNITNTSIKRNIDIEENNVIENEKPVINVSDIELSSPDTTPPPSPYPDKETEDHEIVMWRGKFTKPDCNSVLLFAKLLKGQNLSPSTFPYDLSSKGRCGLESVRKFISDSLNTGKRRIEVGALYPENNTDLSPVQEIRDFLNLSNKGYVVESGSKDISLYIVPSHSETLIQAMSLLNIDQRNDNSLLNIIAAYRI